MLGMAMVHQCNSQPGVRACVCLLHYSDTLSVWHALNNKTNINKLNKENER